MAHEFSTHEELRRENDLKFEKNIKKKAEDIFPTPTHGRQYDFNQSVMTSVNNFI